MPREVSIGLISDTHGLVRPEVHGALAGVALILHAGDVGGRDVLSELSTIAPVRAVRGNVDPLDDPALDAQIHQQVGSTSILVTHGHELGQPTPARLLQRYDADVIVYGHTHKALIERAGRQLVVNPGAAGPRRFRLVPSVAILTIGEKAPRVEVIELLRLED